MSSFFIFLLVFSSGVEANKCIVSGRYLTLTPTANAYVATVANAPEDGVLEDVGDKKCGFSKRNGHIEYVAVNVKNDSDEAFCSNVGTRSHTGRIITGTICVCSFFGCNSLSGTYFETLVNSSWNGNITGEFETQNNSPSRLFAAARIRQIAIMHGVPGIDDTRFFDDPGYRVDIKKKHPSLFPDEAKRNALIQKGICLDNHPASACTTTSTTTTTPTPSSTTGPPSEQSALKEDPNSSDSNEEKLLKMMYGGVIALTVIIILLLVFILVAFFILRKKLKKGEKTEKKDKETESKSGDTDPKQSKEQTSTDTTSTKGPTKTAELSTRPANDMDTIDACKSDWSTMAGLTNATQMTKF